MLVQIHDYVQLLLALVFRQKLSMAFDDVGTLALREDAVLHVVCSHGLFFQSQCLTTRVRGSVDLTFPPMANKMLSRKSELHPFKWPLLSHNYHLIQLDATCHIYVFPDSLFCLPQVLSHVFSLVS